MQFLSFVILASAIASLEAVSIEQDLTLTLSQKQALDKFRQQVKPLLTKPFMRTDIYLIRWLRARGFNVNSAEHMLKQNLRWRQEKKIDTIMNEDFHDIWKDYPASVDTHDKESRPVGVIDIMDWDIREAAVSGRGPKLLRYLDMLLENVTMQVFERQQSGFNVSQWTVLANAENFNMINHGCPLCIPLWIQFLSSLENNYPGWLNEFIVVEAPQAVFTVFDILKPFLSPQTRNAIKIMSMNRNAWMSYLDARVERSERRAPYGGTKPPAERL